MFCYVRTDGSKDVEPDNIFYYRPIKKFHERLPRLVNEVAHANFIFHESLFEVPIEFGGTAMFDALKYFFQFIVISRNVFRACFEINAIRWIQPGELVIISNVFSELLKKSFKYIRHPIPTWTHVKSEA